MPMSALVESLIYLGSDPPTNQILNHPVAKEEGEYTSEGEDPQEDCFWHLSGSPSGTSPDT